MLGNCSSENSLNSNNDNIGSSDVDSYFPRKQEDYATSNLEPKNVRDVGSINTNNEQVASLWKQLNFYSSDDKEKLILEERSLTERANMTSSYTSSNFSFYLYLSIICEVGVRLPFSSFTTEVLTELDVALPKSRPTTI